MVEDPTGHVLHLSRKRSASPSEVEVQNNLGMGSINANCIKDGKLLGTKTDLAPGQKAVFEIFPVIYIGVVSQATQGASMDAAIVSQINTQINLLGGNQGLYRHDRRRTGPDVNAVRISPL
jgi:hypothetical protein